MSDNDAGKHTRRYWQLANADWLRTEYVEKGRNTYEIARELGCTARSVNCALERHGIERRSRAQRRRYPLLYDPDWLKVEYVEKGRSSVAIARELGCQKSAVLHALRRHGIDRRLSTPPLVVVGERYDRLLVTADAGVNSHQKRIYVCLCDCGTRVVVIGTRLRKGYTRSCGCLHREMARERARTSPAFVAQRAALVESTRTHGLSDTPTYSSWGAMVQRATNPRNPNYETYGANGRTVCARFRRFEAFLEALGERPEWATGGLDRIDNTGGYWCGHCDECVALGHSANCRWATKAQQRANQ